MTRRRAGSTGEDRLLKTIAASVAAHPHSRRPGPTIGPASAQRTGSAGEAANPPCATKTKPELHRSGDSDERFGAGPLGETTRRGIVEVKIENPVDLSPHPLLVDLSAGWAEPERRDRPAELPGGFRCDDEVSESDPTGIGPGDDHRSGRAEPAEVEVALLDLGPDGADLVGGGVSQTVVRPVCLFHFRFRSPGSPSPQRPGP